MVRRYLENGLRYIGDIDVPWEESQVVWTHDEGAYTIVKNNSQWDYQLESYFLAHCIGTKDYAEFSKAHVVYSLRDRLGIPHATILCVRPQEFSPYGRCWDIGSVSTFTPEPTERDLRILQVRGRNDDIAMPLFHSYVRDWFTRMGGVIDVDIAQLVLYLTREGDADTDYHFRYLLDEERNPFRWGYWNTRMRRLAVLEGTSL